jgi:hypothetical protein
MFCLTIYMLLPLRTPPRARPTSHHLGAALPLAGRVVETAGAVPAGDRRHVPGWFTPTEAAAIGAAGSLALPWSAAS